MKIDGKPIVRGEQLSRTEEKLPRPTADPRGGKDHGVKTPDGREQSGKEDAAVVGKMKTDTVEASPRTASEGPATTMAGATGGPTRTGGEHRAGGTRLGDGGPASRAPGARAVVRKMTSRAATSDRGAAQEVLLAEG